MGYYDKVVLRQHLLLSMVPYGIFLRRHLLPSPRPCLFLCPRLSLSAVRPPSSATRHPLPAFVTKFTAQSSRLSLSSPPALVTLFAPPALRHCPRRCCRDARMQKSWDADVDVNVGVNCVCLLLLTIGGAALPRPFPRCSQCSPLPLSSLLSSLSSPRRSCHCCHPYNFGANAAR
jgi:hypothetical protein